MDRGFHRDMSFDEALSLVRFGPVSLGAVLRLLTCDSTEALRLYSEADGVRSEVVGDAIHLRALVEFSNHCRQTCSYCGISATNRKPRRYRMEPREIVDVALLSEEMGFGTIVLQSGEDMWFSTERLAEIIGQIRDKTQLAITLGVGARPFHDYQVWRQAGADRFLLRIETTDPDLFARLHPHDSLAARMRCLRDLHALDYQVGSGVMIGLPGQGPEMLAKDILWMQSFKLDMIGVGPFLPHPDTSLADCKAGTMEQTLRLVAIVRLMCPHTHIPATTAMGSLVVGGREAALTAGANVLMPNMTPAQYREDYAIYPDKVGIDARSDDNMDGLRRRIRDLGRTIGIGPGHVVRK